MTTLNRSARDAMVKYRVHACTDVTGFGLLGHACEMAQGSDVEMELRVADIDLIGERWSLRRWACCRRGCTATAPSRSPGWMLAIRSYVNRTSSTIPRPPAGC